MAEKYVRLSRTTYGFAGKYPKSTKSKKRYYAAFFVGGRKVNSRTFSTQEQANKALDSWTKMHSRRLQHPIHRDYKSFSNPHFKATSNHRKRSYARTQNNNPLFGGDFRL
jgi:hypothetical protein